MSVLKEEEIELNEDENQTKSHLLALIDEPISNLSYELQKDGKKQITKTDKKYICTQYARLSILIFLKIKIRICFNMIMEQSLLYIFFPFLLVFTV